MSTFDPETEKKILVAKQKKEVGDQAFKEGKSTDALRAYHEAVLYLAGITKNVQSAMASNSGNAVDQAAEPKVKTETDEMLEKIYANMSACHIKNGNWKRALETAEKSLAKNDNNPKALFRKAKALGEQGYFERAEETFEKLLKQKPSDAPSIQAEYNRFRAIDKEREKAHNQKFRGFLNRDKGEKSQN